MKISKVAAVTARRIFGLCQSGGRLDETKFRAAVAQLVETKPRDYRAILAALHRLARLEIERRRVTVESAIPLDEITRQRVVAGLAKQYGSDLAVQYQVNAALIGGLRIRVGDDVFDGSVQGRLNRLASVF
jgi:F-type H+-transporting ATPase subunit delta